MWFAAGQTDDLQPNPYTNVFRDDPWFVSRNIENAAEMALWMLRNVQQTTREDQLRASDREAWQKLLLVAARDGTYGAVGYITGTPLTWRSDVRTMQRMFSTSPPDRAGYLDGSTQRAALARMRQVASTYDRASFTQDAEQQARGVVQSMRQQIDAPGVTRTKVVLIAGAGLIAGWLIWR